MGCVGVIISRIWWRGSVGVRTFWGLIGICRGFVWAVRRGVTVRIKRGAISVRGRRIGMWRRVL
jgi:hypothetical protein